MQRLICPHCEQEIVLVVKKKAKPKEKKPKEDKPMTLLQFQSWCEKTGKRFLQIIGAWAGITQPSMATISQWTVYVKRNSRPAMELSKFSEEQVQQAFSKVEEDHKKGMTYQPALETLLKKLTK